MNAIYLQAFGGVEQLVGGLQPRPVAAPGDVLVEVEASGINLADTYIRRGAFPIEESLPFIPGMEGVGRILALGEGVGGLRVGERVVFAAPGSYGAYVTIPLQGAAPWISLAPAPEGLPLAELASLGMAGRTAWGLVNRFVTGGGKALVYAGAGGVGSILIQLLRRRGIEVVAMAGSPHKAQAVRALGARAVEYRRQPLEEGGFDYIFNGVGGASLARDVARLAPQGHLIWFGFAEEAGAPGLMEALQAHFMAAPSLHLFNGGLMSTAQNRTAYEELISGLEEGWLRIQIGALYGPEQIGEAHRHLESGQSQGKLVLMRSRT